METPELPPPMPSVRFDWMMQLVSAAQVLACVAGADPRELRKEASELLGRLPVPNNHLEHLIAKAILLPIAIRHAGLLDEDVMLAAFGDQALQLAGSRSCHSITRFDSPADRAKQIIDAECTTDLTVYQLSRRLHVHRNALSTAFVRTFGVSIPDYIRCRRMHLAPNLLRTTPLRIDAVAAQLGYHSKGFYVQFPRVMGMTPASFRARTTL